MCQRVHGNHARKLSCHLVSGIPFTNTEHVEFLLNGNEANYIHLDFIQLNFKKSYPIRKVRGIGGLVVEYSPATRVTRVRFPANADKFLNSIWIGAELDKNGTKMQYGCRGRVVKAMDSKSIGIFPRRFESCRQRAVLKDYFEGYP